jgi:hypothetical protein
VILRHSHPFRPTSVLSVACGLIAQVPNWSSTPVTCGITGRWESGMIVGRPDRHYDHRWRKPESGKTELKWWHLNLTTAHRATLPEAVIDQRNRPLRSRRDKRRIRRRWFGRIPAILPQPSLQLGNLGLHRLHHPPRRRVLRSKLLIIRTSISGHHNMIEELPGRSTRHAVRHLTSYKNLAVKY